MTLQHPAEGLETIVHFQNKLNVDNKTNIRLTLRQTDPRDKPFNKIYVHYELTIVDRFVATRTLK